MKYLITGGTGFIGAKLVEKLLNNGDEVTIISRNPKKAEQKFDNKINAFSQVSDINGRYFDVVINLAGKGIADSNWSPKVKQEIYGSRIDLTKQLILYISRLATKPKLLISASAIGYYGFSESQEFTENDDKINSDSFSHKLCADWEAEAKKAESFGVRTVITRFGIVLGKNGGALKRMLTPFKFGLGGKIGSGRQYMGWVHLQDVIDSIEHIISNESINGAVNITSPNAVTNAEFTKALAKSLNRPAFFDMPAKIVEILFGQMGKELLLKGQKVAPQKLLENRFKFKYSNLKEAFESII